MSEFMKDYSEKRDFHRMKMNSEIELTDSNGVALPGICKDLSGAGMQLFVERAFSEGDEIHTLLPSTSDQLLRLRRFAACCVANLRVMDSCWGWRL